MNQFTVSLWGDEAFSAVLSMRPVSQIISIITKDTSPPLFNILEHFWFQIFGNSEVAIRSLVFIYFLVAVFFVYKIGSYLWDKKTGYLAASLTFLNPFLFAYGFEGRMYSLLLATVTASFYFFISKRWIGYALATTLALYSHHFAIFAVFVQGLWFLKEMLNAKWPMTKTMLLAFIAIGLLYSPWVLPLYNQTRMVGGGFWLGKPSLYDLGFLFLRYLNISVLLLLLRDWGKEREKSFLLLGWLLVPIFVTWLVSQKFTSIFFDRYLLYTVPAGMLLAASQRQKFASFALGFVILAFLAFDIFFFSHPFKRPFRDLANYVKEVKKGDDFLLNWNSASHHLWEAKYYGIDAPLYIQEGTQLPFFVGTALMTKDDVVSSLPKKKINRVGVITSGKVEEVAIPGYKNIEHKEFGDLKFIWLTR